ncbi:hypothetical protein IV203_002635 [Nitzschia inconspicua]|uniref:Uncharacterized protein n=1 Tax=Nitzschia inconspicua TaxID=303405 RepID=A0A9K3P9U5_9STRA|nr:hypothetical protein IV203_002635 [Nitzschia inconspicua]
MAGGESAVSSGGGSSSSSSMPSLTLPPLPYLSQRSLIRHRLPIWRIWKLPCTNMGEIFATISVHFSQGDPSVISQPVVRFLWYNVNLLQSHLRYCGGLHLDQLVTSGLLFQLQNVHLYGFTRVRFRDDKNRPEPPPTLTTKRLNEP